MLEHHAHLAPPQLDQALRAGCQQILAVKQDLAGAGLDQARQAAHERRLAGARQAHDDEDLADMNIEIGVDHRRDLAAGAQPLARGRRDRRRTGRRCASRRSACGP